MSGSDVHANKEEPDYSGSRAKTRQNSSSSSSSSSSSDGSRSKDPSTSSSSSSSSSDSSASATPPRKRPLSAPRDSNRAKPPVQPSSPEPKRRRYTPSPRRHKSPRREREQDRERDKGRPRDADRDRYRSRDRPRDHRQVWSKEGDVRRRRSSPESTRFRRDTSPPQRHRERRQPNPQEAELPGPPPISRGGDGRAGPRGDGPERRQKRWSQQEAPPGPNGPPGKEVWGAEGNRAEPKKEAKEVEPDFGLSGALAEETNKVNGVALVYSEPPEASNPTLRWRLYTFKGGELVGEPLYIHRQSSYLFGRERRVADIPADHPSCSKQHAVLQYRRTSKNGPDEMPVEGVRPYLMDLGSTNGTFINNERLEPQRFYELMEKDVVKLGNSSREYVLLHEGSLAGS